jgi:hypothetical protein
MCGLDADYIRDWASVQNDGRCFPLHGYEVLEYDASSLRCACS